MIVSIYPHLLVGRPDISTTKVRIVFDGAAKQDGKSLNDVTHQSSQLQKDLVSVLWRFKRYPPALVYYGDLKDVPQFLCAI